jgi:two-component system, OmpR family, response regulator
MLIEKIMLVDDDEDLRLIGRIALADVGGWQTLLAAGGREAVELAVRERPDVILLDVMMPEIDGAMTFRMLRSTPSTCEIPVIFMTAKVQTHEVQRYIELGAAGVICKPFDPIALPDEIRRIITSSSRAEARGHD